VLLCVNIADFPSTDESQNRVLWEDLLDLLDAVSPLIDDVCLGTAFLDMHGANGGASAWMAQTRELVARCELAPRLGVGSNKIAARAAAYFADGTICENGAERELLAPLPLHLLGIDPETIERLVLLGIERLGDLARLPHGPFVRRFGTVAAYWHALANGCDRTPFVPRGHAVAIEASIFGEGRVADETQVFFALRMLLARICADLDRCGKRAGALRLEIELEDAQTHAFDVTLATPTVQERTMLDMLRAKLEGATFPAAIVGLRVQAGRLEEGGEAQALFAADDLDPQRVAVAIARLEAALGDGVSRARTREAHLLEERFAYEPFVPPVRVMFEEAQAESELVPQLRLLQVREVSVQLRGGEPAVVDRRAVHECVGPWRASTSLSTGFLERLITRDEYDVVLDDGTFARIYRQGSRWYLRGVYE
jgi:protein ImuB